MGHLGGSASYASDFSSGHHLGVQGVSPAVRVHVQLRVGLSLSPSPCSRSLSLSQIRKI